MSNTYTFTDATKAGARMRVALTAPTGSGKTYTALRLATAFGGTIGLVDTDRHSASKYADRFTFKTVPMFRYDPADLVTVCAIAEDQGIDTLIIDTWSPFWSGEKGMLDQVDDVATASRGDKFGGGWKAMKPVERRMLDAMFGFSGHLIVTVRSKVEWVVERNPDTGKMGPRRIGLKPDQRDGFEQDFDVAGVLDDAILSITKSRCGDAIPIGAVYRHPGEDLADIMIKWLGDGAVGDPFSPATVQAWVMDDDRTVPDLRAKFDELTTNGLIGSVVMDGDESITLGALLRRRRAELTHAAAGTVPVSSPL